MDSDDKVLNTRQNISDYEEPKVYRQSIWRPNAYLWYTTMNAEMDALQHNHTWDVVDRPTHRQIVDSEWVLNILRLSDGCVHKFKAHLVK
jgi:hypothetical protein